MKRFIGIAFFVALFPFICLGQQSQSSQSSPLPPRPDGMSAARTGTFETELSNTERDLAEALRRRDADGLKKILSEDFVYTDAATAGQSLNRAQYIESALALKLEGYNFTNTVARAYGSTFVFSSLYTQTINAGPSARTDEFFITDIWLRRDNRWQMAARYSSRSARTEPAARTDLSAQSKPRIEADPKLYDAYAGKYELAPNAVMNITREGSKLVGQTEGQSKVELLPLSETEFYVKELNVQLTFGRDEKGQVVSLTLRHNGAERRARKIK